MEPMEDEEEASMNLHDLQVDPLPECHRSLPRFMPIHEVVPRLTLYERVRLDTLTSLNFLEFQGVNTNIIGHPEKHILFKGFRILEKRIERLNARRKIGIGYEGDDRMNAFLVYLKIGHVTLLAADYSRALSAYQQALKLSEDQFWKDCGAFYGLGIVYLHFKAYGSAIEAFNRHLYSNPTSITASETNARLGVCYKAVKLFPDALRHFHSALNDRMQPSFLTPLQLKLNIALTHDSAGDIDKAYKECTTLLTEATMGGNYLRAAIERELGWLCYRAVDADICVNPAERMDKLREAEQHLQESKVLMPESGKTHYYLGRCFGEQTPSKAHDAFLNYRASIDKSESDSDTWCSIGVLYHQQNQPMDALQAFMCAVDLDPEHSAAWTNLGNLYEQHFRFADSLECYKRAIKHNPTCPEVLKARIVTLESQLQSSPALLNTQPRPGPFLPPGIRLPALKEANAQPIPSELRQRQEEFVRNKQQRYRDGSALWRMGELGSVTMEPNIRNDARMLDSSELNMLRIFKYAENDLDETCKTMLASLDNRLKLYGCFEGTELPVCPYTVQQLQAEMHASEALKNFTSIFEIDEDGDTVVKPKEEIEDSESDDESDGGAVTPAATAKGDRSTNLGTELPTQFSLLAQIKVPMDVTASELLTRAHQRVDKPSEFKEIFEEKVAPPVPPTHPPNVKGDPTLNRPTPMVTVETRKDAHSIELHKFCESSPIVLIRGMSTALKMDLSLFSTKTLLENYGDHEVEVRTQYKMPTDLNMDLLGRPTWACDSVRSFTTIQSYAKYQADNFKQSLKEESDKLRIQNKYGADAKRRRLDENGLSHLSMKQIKFGTNVDLSDDVKFKAQLTELAKMPPFCRVIAGCNLLTHLGHSVYGMNTVQLYMKVPGNRTPGHTENNCLASVNLNIGPGDCEWFGVPYEYWGDIDEKCKKEGIDFLKGVWWPNPDELIQAGIPVYRFTQKAGDLVWVGSGCVHWVQSTGWCNNVAWNVGPMTHSQLTMAVHQYEWNRMVNYKSLVPMQHLFWQIAKNVRCTNQKVYNLVRGMLIRSLSYTKMVVDWAEKQHLPKLPILARTRPKTDQSNYCSYCEAEVFNLIFSKDKEGTYEVACVDCARRGEIKDYYIIQYHSFEELSTIFDNFQLHMIAKATLVA